jgi:hypothetical protein
MQRMLGLYTAVAVCLLAASPASAQGRYYPGQVPCVSVCIPQGAICCPQANRGRGGWCPPGHLCDWRGGQVDFGDTALLEVVAALAEAQP